MTLIQSYKHKIDHDEYSNLLEKKEEKEYIELIERNIFLSIIDRVFPDDIYYIKLLHGLKTQLPDLKTQLISIGHPIYFTDLQLIFRRFKLELSFGHENNMLVIILEETKQRFIVYKVNNENSNNLYRITNDVIYIFNKMPNKFYPITEKSSFLFI
jgi:hypothetical protein